MNTGLFLIIIIWGVVYLYLVCTAISWIIGQKARPERAGHLAIEC